MKLFAQKPPIGVAAVLSIYAEGSIETVADVFQPGMATKLVNRFNQHERLVEALQAIVCAEQRCTAGSRETYAAACQARIDAMLGAERLLAEITE